MCIRDRFGTFAIASAQTISFDKTTIDYGTIPVNADGNRVFTFKNTGDKPLILSNVQPGCCLLYTSRCV